MVITRDNINVLEEMIMDYESPIFFECPSLEEFRFIRKKIWTNSPLLFNISGIKYNYSNKKGRLAFEFKYPKDEYDALLSFVQIRLNKIIQGMPSCLSELEKEKYIHDYIATYVKYVDMDSKRSKQIIYPLLAGYGICETIALLAKALFDKAGIESYRVSGSRVDSNGVTHKHAWNIVKIDGKYYHLDVTKDLANRQGVVSYKYFNVDSKTYGKTMKINEDYEYLDKLCTN